MKLGINSNTDYEHHPLERAKTRMAWFLLFLRGGAPHTITIHSGAIAHMVRFHLVSHHLLHRRFNLLHMFIHLYSLLGRYSPQTYNPVPFQSTADGKIPARDVPKIAPSIYIRLM